MIIIVEIDYNKLIKLIYIKEYCLYDEFYNEKNIDLEINKFDCNCVIKMKNLQYLLNEMFDYKTLFNYYKENYKELMDNFYKLNDDDKKKNFLIENVNFLNELNKYKLKYFDNKNKKKELKKNLKNYLNNISEDIINTNILYIKDNNIGDINDTFKDYIKSIVNEK